MANQLKMRPLVEMEAEGPRGSSNGQSGGSGGPGLWGRLKSSPVGKVLLGVFVAAAIGLFAIQFIDFYEEGQANHPLIRIMNPETGELRWFQTDYSKPLPEGFYFVEYCFNRSCGPAGGTPVVLNEARGMEGPTQCPACGSTVVGHNPRPEEYQGVDPADWSKRD